MQETVSKMQLAESRIEIALEGNQLGSPLEEEVDNKLKEVLAKSGRVKQRIATEIRMLKLRGRQ